MNSSEYFAFLPLLIYGIALAEFLGQWKRIFDKDQLFWPYFLTTVIFTEVVIWNVFSYLDVIKNVADIQYLSYWIHLLPPLVFLITVNVLTPEQGDKDTQGYFKKRMSIVFELIALFIGCHFLPGLSLGSELDLPRMAGAALCGLIAITRKENWSMYYLLFGLSACLPDSIKLKNSYSTFPFYTKIGICILFLSFSLRITAQKTDKIYMYNGDHLTCEIKWMEFGKVKVKVDEMSSIYIEWDAVDSIWSDRKYEILFEGGELEKMSLESEFYSRTNGDLSQVIKLEQMRSSFFKRLKGDVSLGFSYDKSSDILRLILDADITHRKFKKSTTLTFGTVFTLDNEKERTKKRNTRIIQSWFGRK